ncbi:MAG: L-serine ammonia-lyase, iron-sulfur-dependent subunit beta [Clostridia bacterium]|nr:L-serine ammonia-lyase, iron-sulfur-dependent subunit beta [Clostridia bacterium]
MNGSVFDIIGPVMVGPSSSHTAGAVRLARAAASICSGKVVDVKFELHGSFAKTYKGHGTDKALVAGIMGMKPDDDKIRDAFSIAKEKDISFSFQEADLGDVHPNTVKFIVKTENDEHLEIVGSSIGGGEIIITELNGERLEITGRYPTIVTKHMDKPGVIAKVSSVLALFNINVAFMKVYRNNKGLTASMILETDQMPSENAVECILQIPEIKDVKLVKPV